MAGIELDKSFAVPVYSTVCLRCKHYRPGAEGAGRQCAAFPAADSIPLEIWRGDNKHLRPFPGDNGITFEPVQ